jgi:hypothetical protein
MSPPKSGVNCEGARQVATKLQLAVETVYRWLRSGKLRGARISQKAWRVAERDLRSFMTKQNVSELLFEGYITEHRLGVPDRESVVPGKSRRIDYRLSFKDQTLWFEVKEFAEDPSSFAEARLSSLRASCIRLSHFIESGFPSLIKWVFMFSNSLRAFKAALHRENNSLRIEHGLLIAFLLPRRATWPGCTSER